MEVTPGAPPPPPDIKVRIDVGGKRFTTTVTTLGKDNRLSDDLKKVDSVRTRVGDYKLFYDRDPTFFRHILNYLRDPNSWVDVKRSDRAEVAREADFYRLPKLQGMLVDPVLQKIYEKHPTLGFLIETTTVGIRLCLHALVMREIYDRYKSLLSGRVVEYSSVYGFVRCTYGEVYDLIALFVRILHRLRYHLVCTTNINKTHIEYAFEHR